VGQAGDASYSNGTFTIDGGGADIWNTADEFHFVYQTLPGDGEIVARVVSVENTNAWAKAGVMMRETLATGSKHAMMVLTPGNGLAFQRRTTTNGSSSHTSGGSASAPYWVRLVRSGDTFTGYKSSDGSNWTEVGSASITMPSTIFVGLPVTAHNDGTLCTSVIDNVDVSAGSPTPTPTPVPNLVGNPGFETGSLSPWGQWNDVSVVSSEQRSGSYCLRVGNAYASSEQVVTVDPSTSYTLTGWAKMASGSSGDIIIGVKDYGGSQLTENISSTSYTQASIDFTSGSSNTTAKIFCYRHTGTGYAYCDDFSVVEQ
jgi:hypothetical protein